MTMSLSQMISITRQWPFYLIYAMLKLAQLHSLLTQKLTRTSLDCNRKNIFLKVGDLVLLTHPTSGIVGVSKKFDSYYKGLFEILKIDVQTNCVTIQRMSIPHKTQTVHIDRFKPIHILHTWQLWRGRLYFLSWGYIHPSFHLHLPTLLPHNLTGEQDPQNKSHHNTQLTPTDQTNTNSSSLLPISTTTPMVNSNDSDDTLIPLPTAHPVPL